MCVFLTRRKPSCAERPAAASDWWCPVSWTHTEDRNLQELGCWSRPQRRRWGNPPDGQMHKHVKGERTVQRSFWSSLLFSHLFIIIIHLQKKPRYNLQGWSSHKLGTEHKEIKKWRNRLIKEQNTEQIKTTAISNNKSSFNYFVKIEQLKNNLVCKTATKKKKKISNINYHELENEIGSETMPCGTPKNLMKKKVEAAICTSV